MKIPKLLKYIIAAVAVAVIAFVVIVVITVAPALERLGWL